MRPHPIHRDVFSLVVLGLVGTVVPSCDSDGGSRRDGGDGAADKGSGAASDVATDGAGPDAVGSGCFPPCILDLFATCTAPAGACVRMTGLGVRWSCFENGVKIRANGNRSGGGGNWNVTLPDGISRCYSLGINSQSEVEYFNRPGDKIATVIFSAPGSNQGTVTCTKGGSTHPIDLDSAACADSRYGLAGETATMCTVGACEIPIPM